MKKNKNIINIFLLAIFLTSFLTFFSCGTNNKEEESDTGITLSYTCPMHPQIISHTPSTCPVCGMDLVVFDKNNQDEFLTLGPEQILLANIQTMAIGKNGTDAVRILNGKISNNETAVKYISSRINGRIEELYVNEEGRIVKKGQPILKLYSEELAALQNELKISAEQIKAFPDNQRFKEIYEAAVHKLKLYGISENQINSIEENKNPQPFFTIHASESGTVTNLLVREGNYVSAGEEILRIEDFSTLWVEIEVYPNELEMIKKEMKIKAVFPATGDREYDIKIDFIAPEIIPGTQLTKIRGNIKNTDGLLLPGSQAKILLKGDVGKGNLIIPQNAIINESSGSHVWIEFEPGKFEAREVTTGITGNNTAEILSGLSEGDKLVISGAYLLYSEYILKRGKHPINN